jgi:hypothetical protein
MEVSVCSYVKTSIMSRHQFTLGEKIGIIGRLEYNEKNILIENKIGTHSSRIYQYGKVGID